MLRRACAIACAAALIGGVSLAAGRSANRDPFFPGSGSDAYDVSHYGVSLSYFPLPGAGARSRIAARVSIRAHARRPLRHFSLDLVGLQVRKVEVDGARAAHMRLPRKLVVTPAAPIPSGAGFVATVSYRGRPGTVTDPDGSKEGCRFFSIPAVAPQM